MDIFGERQQFFFVRQDIFYLARCVLAHYVNMFLAENISHFGKFANLKLHFAINLCGESY
jgi:hypothetical protein